MVTVASVPYRILESQVDWLTVTRRGSLQDDKLLNLGQFIAAREGREDPTICDWHWRGYSGSRGQHFAYGRRWDTDILQLSSHLAAEYLDDAWTRAHNCSRIDLAVTVQYDEEAKGVVRDSYVNGCKWNEEHANGAERAYITNSQGGSTSYIGARTSDLFARIYDKWRESRDERYRYAIRWEVECKAEIANRVIRRVSSSADRSSLIRNIVSTHFRRRGAASEWMADGAEVRVASLRAPSGTLSHLSWLDSSVRPVIAKLIPLVDFDTLFTALGLDPEEYERLKRRLPSQFDGHQLELFEEGQDETH